MNGTAKKQPSGSLVGGWRLGRLIGAGGAASVYEATAKGARGALKLLRPEHALEPKMRSRFLREVRIAATVRHPAAVAILDSGETDDELAYFVMELLEGETLEDRRVRSGGRLGVDVTLRIARELLDFLRAVHSLGVVHRDIKPSNLFLTNEGRLKVLDFGIAASLLAEVGTLRTEVGSLLGTPAFMAPEHARGRFDEVDARADLWSTGATLFTLLTGRLVHEAENALELLGRAMTLQAPSISEILPNLPSGLRRTIDGALRYDAVERWQSATEMLAALSNDGPNVALESASSVETLMSAQSASQPRVVAPIARRSPELASPLPSEVDDFIGRTAEIAAIEALLDRARLVTLTGPGGSGKTRLALRVAATRIAHHSDGVAFIALESVRETSLVLPAIARGLALKEAPSDRLPELVTSYLRPLSKLLVLDNLEQVRAAAPLLTILLEAAPGLRVLATSRAKLRLRGEHVYEVPPMPVPERASWSDPARVASSDGVRLLVERARSVDPSFELTGYNAEAVAEIVQRLDGLPLALEIAAARFGVWTPEELAVKLRGPLQELPAGPVDLPKRQRTLQETLDWSLELLDSEAQQAFRWLGVFVGGFSSEAAIAVLGGEAARAEALLGDLVDMSLVRRRVSRGRLRFSLLETVREFAARQLEATSDSIDVHERHLAHYAGVAEALEPRLTGRGQRDAISVLLADVANLRAAMEFAADNRRVEEGLRLAAATWRFWHAIGQANEARASIERLLAGGTPTLRVQARAASAAAGIAYWQGRFERALALYEQVLEHYRKAGEAHGVAETTLAMSQTLTWSGDSTRGAELAGDALQRFEALGDRAGIGQALMARGFSCWIQGKLDEARPLWERSKAIALEVGDRVEASTKTLALASLTFLEGHPKRALEEAMGAFRDLVELDNHAFVVMAMDWMASIGSAVEPERALMLAAAAERHRDELGGGMRPKAVGLPEPRQIAASTLSPATIEKLQETGSCLELAAAIDLAHAWCDESLPRD